MRRPNTFAPEAERYLMAERAALLQCMETSRLMMEEAAARVCEIDREIGRLDLLGRVQADQRVA